MHKLDIRLLDVFEIKDRSHQYEMTLNIQGTLVTMKVRLNNGYLTILKRNVFEVKELFGLLSGYALITLGYYQILVKVEDTYYRIIPMEEIEELFVWLETNQEKETSLSMLQKIIGPCIIVSHNFTYEDSTPMRFVEFMVAEPKEDYYAVFTVKIIENTAKGIEYDGRLFEFRAKDK